MSKGDIMRRRSIFASAFVTSCIVGPSMVGCSADTEAPQNTFEVSSDVQAGNPEALAIREPFSGPEGVGEASSALTRTEFAEAHCPVGIDFCGLDLSGNRTIRSDGRVERVAGVVDVLEGSVRLRVFRDRAGTAELLTTRIVSAGNLVPYDARVSGIDRRIRVIIDQAGNAVYHLSVNFSG
ncbi:hypothetical protein [Polyangium fumosum]|uniref:Uncharacterized protein n=1 Tax=Polyangium fumosum TaxID=889272 RepID=A0A4U1JHV2_9BACT|nr:hypothetical protein [Polyangium fumosum]TKD12189.1 hypothetical protein E8A74_06170 [Polyangium fumosum]